jgi:RHS repeat-associated protein
MQLHSDVRIPDGLLAANALLNEKPHQGVPSWNLALHQGIDERNSTAAIGIRASAQLNRNWSRYTAKERDSESGLDYFGARYYASSMGRFTSPDSPSYSHLSNPQAWNLYAYTYNNPVSTWDPDGHDVACGGANGQQLLKDANAATGGGSRVVCNTKITPHSFLGFHWSTTESKLGVTGDPATFRALGMAASRLVDLIDNHSFTLTVNYGNYPNPGGAQSFLVSQGEKAPSVLIDPRRPESGYDPDATSQGIPEASTAEEFGHEVLGHQWGELINGEIDGSTNFNSGIYPFAPTSRANMRDAIRGENAVRSLDPTRGQKALTSHHSYDEAPKDGPK